MRTPTWATDLVLRMRGVFSVGPRFHGCDKNQRKELTLPVTLISGQKYWLHDQ